MQAELDLTTEFSLIKLLVYMHQALNKLKLKAIWI